MKVSRKLSASFLDSFPNYQATRQTLWFIVGALFIISNTVEVSAQSSEPTIKFDKDQYTWTDKVFITVEAPNFNFDSNLIDEIGAVDGIITIETKGSKLSGYKFVESGTDAGVFTGEIILTGFASHDADGDGHPNDATGIGPSGHGPSDGFLPAPSDGVLSVTFDYDSDYPPVTETANISWNVGETTWSEESYPSSGTGIVTVTDPDMNLNPETVDVFKIDVWSDSDAGGIDLTVAETGEATGIFEGNVQFTTFDESSGNRLRVAEGDTVTVEYEDRTLPKPYTSRDQKGVIDTAIIGTVDRGVDSGHTPVDLTVNTDKEIYMHGRSIEIFGFADPSLNFQTKADLSNSRIVDAFGNKLDEISVGQQILITADLTNVQDGTQPFAYLVQVRDQDGFVVSLAWISGSLALGQAFSPALSWTPNESGTYYLTTFVFEDIENLEPLGYPTTMRVGVESQTTFDSGTISFGAIPVTFKIINPVNGAVTIDLGVINNNKEYSTEIKAGGLLWNRYGEYTVEAHQKDQKAITGFLFTQDIPQCPPEGYAGKYTPSTGNTATWKSQCTKVLKFSMDKNAISLILEVESSKNDVLTVNIQRSLIDSKDPSGNDADFLILVDGKETGYEEKRSSSSRTVIFQLEGGAEEIEIIGTQLLGPPKKAPIAIMDGPSSTQAGSMLTLTAYESYDPDGGNIVQYRWEIDGGVVKEGPKVSLTFSSGSHTVILTVTDDEGKTNRIVREIMVDGRPPPPPPPPPPPTPIWVYITIGGGIGGGTAVYFGIKKFIKPPKPIPPAKFWIEIDGGVDK